MKVSYTTIKWGDGNWSSPLRDVVDKKERLDKDNKRKINRINFSENSFKNLLDSDEVQKKLCAYPNSYEKFKKTTNVYSNASALLMNLAGIFDVLEVSVKDIDQSDTKGNVYFSSEYGKFDGVILETSISREDYDGKDIEVDLEIGLK